jgi:hypothetical protein
MTQAYISSGSIIMQKIIFYFFLPILAAHGCKSRIVDTVPDERQLQYTTSSDSLTEGRYAIKLLQTGQFTCFAGGGIRKPNGLLRSYQIDVYNVGTEKWTAFTMLEKRMAYAVAATSDRLFVGGGYSGTRISETVDIFDLRTGVAITSKLPRPRRNMSAAAAGTKVIFAGGLDEALSTAADIYHIAEKRWELAELSEPRSNIIAAANGNKVVFAGGNSPDGMSSVVDIYDIGTGRWATASLSEPKVPAIVLKAGPFLFFAGGRLGDGDTHTAIVDIYNTSTDKWLKLTLPGNQTSVTACSNTRYAFFAFGENPSTGQATQLCIFDLQTGRSRIESLPAPYLSEFSMGTIGNKLVMAGGIQDAKYTSSVVVYDYVKNSFDTTTFRLPSSIWGASATVAGGKLLMAGGLDFSAGAAPVNQRTVRVFELK